MHMVQHGAVPVSDNLTPQGPIGLPSPSLGVLIRQVIQSPIDGISQQIHSLSYVSGLGGQEFWLRP